MEYVDGFPLEDLEQPYWSHCFPIRTLHSTRYVTPLSARSSSACCSPAPPIPNYESGSPKPFPDPPEKPLSYDTSSSTDRAKVQARLKLCQETHKTCSPQQPELALLPHRVIDVSANQVRLVETDKAEGQYVCLSHCWGTVLPSCRTTSETLASNKRNIAWDTLPKTFQDAIDFTRRLGLEYI
jgi:hypothetical protein